MLSLGIVSNLGTYRNENAADNGADDRQNQTDNGQNQTGGSHTALLTERLVALLSVDRENQTDDRADDADDTERDTPPGDHASGNTEYQRSNR